MTLILTGIAHLLNCCPVRVYNIYPNVNWILFHETYSCSFVLTESAEFLQLDIDKLRPGTSYATGCGGFGVSMTHEDLRSGPAVNETSSSGCLLSPLLADAILSAIERPSLVLSGSSQFLALRSAIRRDSDQIIPSGPSVPVTRVALNDLIRLEFLRGLICPWLHLERLDLLPQ